MTTPHIPRIRIYHNGLWAKYKGAIFSNIYSDSSRFDVEPAFVQMSETSRQRAILGDVDLSYHRYPYQLLFHGCSDEIPFYKMVTALVANVLRHRSELVVLPGYHRPEYWAMLVTCMLLRRKRAVFVDSTSYDREKNSWKEAAKGFFFRRCDGFFCYGVRSKDYVASYGIDEQKIFFKCQAAALPHSYNAAAILDYYAGRPREVDSAPRLLYIGRLSEEKGLFDLLAAFQLARRKMPDAKLDIVGSGSLEPELRDRLRVLDLEPAVALLGARTPEEIGDLLMQSNALILPSKSEPWGLVVNEALSYGCPVVVSNICGCVPELVHDGQTGYSFPVGDVSALCAAMIAVVGLPGDRLTIARRCMDLIEQYTPDQAALEILRGCVRIVRGLH